MGVVGATGGVQNIYARLAVATYDDNLAATISSWRAPFVVRFRHGSTLFPLVLLSLDRPRASPSFLFVGDATHISHVLNSIPIVHARSWNRRFMLCFILTLQSKVQVLVQPAPSQTSLSRLFQRYLETIKFGGEPVLRAEDFAIHSLKPDILRWSQKIGG